METKTRASVPPPASRSGFRLLRHSKLLLGIALATVTLVAARFVLRFQQQSLLEHMNESDLAMLLGGYAAVANLLGLGLQILFTGRLVRKLGVAKVNLLYPVSVAIAQGLAFVPGGLPGALVVRFADVELKHAIKTPVSSLFYEPFPDSQRPRRSRGHPWRGLAHGSGRRRWRSRARRFAPGGGSHRMGRSPMLRALRRRGAMAEPLLRTRPAWYAAAANGRVEHGLPTRLFFPRWARVCGAD